MRRQHQFPNCTTCDSSAWWCEACHPRPEPSQWVSVAGRKPTAKDADERGNVLRRWPDRTVEALSWTTVGAATKFGHWMPIPPLPPEPEPEPEPEPPTLEESPTLYERVANLEAKLEAHLKL